VEREAERGGTDVHDAEPVSGGVLRVCDRRRSAKEYEAYECQKGGAPAAHQPIDHEAVLTIRVEVREGVARLSAEYRSGGIDRRPLPDRRANARPCPVSSSTCASPFEGQ